MLIEGRNAFLTDFGLTKRIEGTHAQLTQAGDVVGTIHYVAPEQIEGRDVTRARTSTRSAACSTTASPARCRSRATPTWR